MLVGPGHSDDADDMRVRLTFLDTAPDGGKRCLVADQKPTLDIDARVILSGTPTPPGVRSAQM